MPKNNSCATVHLPNEHLLFVSLFVLFMTKFYERNVKVYFVICDKASTVDGEVSDEEVSTETVNDGVWLSSYINPK